MPPAGVFLVPARKTRKKPAKGAESRSRVTRRSPLETPRPVDFRAVKPSTEGYYRTETLCVLSIKRCGWGPGEGACSCGSTLLRCPAAASLDKASLRLADRCHSLPSLFPLPAAVGSFPQRLPGSVLWVLSYRHKKVLPPAGKPQIYEGGYYPPLQSVLGCAERIML